MKRILISTILLASSLLVSAQRSGQHKHLSDSLYQSNKEYASGNKYQKDAILFLDMLADTHPYYVKKERRDVLMGRKNDLLSKCATCNDDSLFVTYLYDVLGKLHDKHTDLVSASQYAQRKARKSAKSGETKTKGVEPGDKGVMANHGTLFDYTLFAEKGICYLQFNQCNDARTLRNPELPRFDNMLFEMFGKIDSLGIKTLVVDTQYNPGGSSRLCSQLLAFLRPVAETKDFETNIRFSNLMAQYNPGVAEAKAKWEADGHANELYTYPQPDLNKNFVQPKVFSGKVVFIQGKRTYSSAGILMTLVRDNHIGTIIGETSTYSPSHYGEVLSYILPNTGTVGSVCSKYFVRPDKQHADDETLEPDVVLNLKDKEVVWQYILDNYAK